MSKDYTKLSDTLLMQECSEDNLRAFNELFARYFESLYKFSLHYLKHTEVAEELAMDVMHNIWRRRAEIQITGEVKNYLFAAMKNTLFNHIRKKQLATVDIDSLGELEHAKDAVDEQMAYKELEHLYQLKLEQLSPQRKKIFQLSREEQLTYPQIAERMGLSINTIKSQMLVSLKYLRENMQEHVDITLALLLCYLLK